MSRAAKMPAERARDFIERCTQEGLVFGSPAFAIALGREFAAAEDQGAAGQVPMTPHHKNKPGRPKGAPNDNQRRSGGT